MADLKVGVLGGGSWGTTVASLVSRNAPVQLWARNPEAVREINTDHTNERYLPGIELPKKLTATEDLAEVVGQATALASEDQCVLVPEFDGRIRGAVVGAEREAAGVRTGPDEFLPVGVDMEVDQWPVVQPGPSQIAVFERETQFAHEV